MRDAIRKFYIIVAIVFVVIALGLYIQFNYFNKLLIGQTQMLTASSRDRIGREISSDLLLKGQIISDASDYISLEKWSNEELLDYMKRLKSNNSSFSSIYFGTTTNVIVNGSGWVPPQTFDLRTRPWYIEAVKENKLIITEVFINASNDKLIITIAKPVYNSNNQLLGVIAGDVSIKDIVSMVKEKQITGKGYSFLIDGKGNILAHPNYEYEPTSQLKNVNEISKELTRYLSQNKPGITKISLDGIDGYLAYRSIENTNWKIGSFIALNESMSKDFQFLRIFLITVISSFTVFIIFLGQQKRYLITPLLTLDADIQMIDIEHNRAFRLPTEEKEPLVVLRNSINVVLDKIEELFEQLHLEEVGLNRAKQQLEYLSYHDQLTGLYNRRFFEEELRRLDVDRNYPMTIVMADVNGLKLINDSFGHVIGDKLIKKVAEVIRTGCRAGDIIARLGGDEFVMLLPKTDNYETEQIIKRIKGDALKEKLDSVEISVSFGWETKNNEEEITQDILKKAEDHMYKKKLFESPSMRGKTIKAIISTLHEKNKREEQHSYRVSLLCKRMGKALGLSEGEIQELKSVGLLHDIGKIAIEENILNKPGKLTNDEWEEIKRHPEIGYRILSTVNDMSEMAEYVLAHHERWDGRGYPKGLKRAGIPFQSRIINIVDSYDAMTSERSYRSALSEETAIEELRKNAGAQFDPELVKVFIEEVLDPTKGLTQVEND